MKKICFLILASIIISSFGYPKMASAGTLVRPPNSLGLLTYWKFDEGEGTSVADYSGQGYTGTVLYGPNWTTGRFGSALSYSGPDSPRPSSNQQFVKNTSIPLVSTFTVSAWIKPNVTSSSHYVASQTRDYACSGWGFKVVDGQLLLFLDTSTSNSGCEMFLFTPYTDTTNWHYVTASYDGAVGKIYIDGSLVAQGSPSVTGNLRYDQTTQFIPFTVGKMAFSFGNDSTSYDPFNGIIDEVKFYNRALTDAEVSTMYQISGKAYQARVEALTLPSQVSGLVLWVDANDPDTIRANNDCTGEAVNGGSVGCWKDKSGSNNNMTRATVSQRPTYHLNAKNNKPVIRVAAAQQQTLDAANINISSNSTVIYASRLTGGVNRRMLSSVVYNWLLGYWGGYRNQAYFGGWVDNPALPADTNWNIYSGARSSAGTSYFYANGITDAVNTNGTVGPHGLTLNGQLNEFSDGEVVEVLAYDRVLSDSERQGLERYLSRKWGIPLGTGNPYYPTLEAKKPTQTKVNSSQNNMLTAGLVGLWSFDGADVSTSMVYDRSWSALHMTRNSVGVTFGKVGQALDLTSSSSYTASPSTSILDTDTHTISFWMRINSVPAYWGKIFSYQPGGSDRSPGIWTYAGAACLHWRYDPGNGGPVSCGGPSGENTYFNLGEWYHIAGVKSGGNFYFYVNGAQTESGAVPSAKTAGAAPLTFGLSGNTGIVSMDEVRIYNRALPANEVGQLYMMGK